jgi:hypothetical protein
VTDWYDRYFARKCGQCAGYANLDCDGSPRAIDLCRAAACKALLDGLPTVPAVPVYTGRVIVIIPEQPVPYPRGEEQAPDWQWPAEQAADCPWDDPRGQLEGASVTRESRNAIVHGLSELGGVLDAARERRAAALDFERGPQD